MLPSADSQRLTNINVVLEGVNQPKPVLSFADMGLHPVMLSNCRKMGYDIPTPIQAYTVPAVLQGNDIVGIAQTGKHSLICLCKSDTDHRRVWQDCRIHGTHPL